MYRCRHIRITILINVKYAHIYTLTLTSLRPTYAAWDLRKPLATYIRPYVYKWRLYAVLSLFIVLILFIMTDRLH